MPRARRSLEELREQKNMLKLVKEDRQLRELIASNRAKKYNDDDIFPMKVIRDHQWRISANNVTLYYLVQWAGIYAHPRFDSWEPHYNFAEWQLRKYNKQKGLDPAAELQKIKRVLTEERRFLRRKRRMSNDSETTTSMDLSEEEKEN